MDDIMIINEFLTTDECDEIMELWHKTPFIDRADKMGIWSYRVKWPVYPERILEKIVDKRLEVSNMFFEPNLDIDNLNITMWRPGDSQPPHTDNGAHNEFPQRKYTSIIYINDGYEGGNTFIPELNFSNKPRKGQLVSFPGIKYSHGVTEVKGGERYTNICWLSSPKL